MDFGRMDDDDLFSSEDQDYDPLDDVLANKVRNGEMRTTYDPVGRELVYFNPHRVCGAFPFELN